MSSGGKFRKAVKATSTDGMLTVNIPEGTVGKDKHGNGLAYLNVSENDGYPQPTENSHIIGMAYNFRPSGATFDPAITMTCGYNPGTLPSGVNEKDLTIAYYDAGNSKWVKLEGTVDSKKHIITAHVSHFTDLAIIGEVKQLPADFSISKLLIQPEQVTTGEVVTISASVANIGGTEGSYRLVLKIDGVIEETQDIVLGAESDESISISFTLTEKDAGIYMVALNGLTGTFNVIAPEQSVRPSVPPTVNQEKPVAISIPESPSTPEPQFETKPPTTPMTEKEPSNAWYVIGAFAVGIIVMVLIISSQVRRR